MFGGAIIFTVLQCLLLFVVQLRSESVNIVGKDCKLSDPIYSNTFDLTPLHNALKYTQKLNDVDYVNFNICGDIVPSCNGKTHVAACYSENGTEHVMGLYSEPQLNDGRIHFNYTGDVCVKNPTLKYNLQIILVCDYSDPIREPITLNEYSEDDCSLHIFVRTAQACLPLPKEIQANDCSVTDGKDRTFNLMALSQYNNRIRNPDNTTFVINVCKPVLYGYEDMCPPGSSICLQNNNESNLSKKFVNYGSTVANPTYEKGKLFMHFTSNEKCNETHNVSSHINFNRDTSIEIGEPEYLGKYECEHRFVWHTTLACNGLQSCVAIDSTTFKYDLTSLAGVEHSVKHENKTYSFGICNIAKTCKGKDGICDRTDSGKPISMGLFNDHLKFEQTGAPYLLYVGGDVCSKPSRQWTTKIEFLCGKTGELGPVVIENTDCDLVIQYKTDLVCRKEINCRAYNYSSSSEIDLTPLISSSVNYLADVNDTLKATEGPPILHYLNVCRPLVPQYGLSCPGGTSVCRAVNKSATPTSELGLGFPDISLTVVKNRAHLKYLRGSVCPKDPVTQLSSVIEFYCDPAAGLGKPILQEILHDCHYVFEWGTNVMCPSHLLTLEADKCEVFNDQLNTTLNLKKITDNGIVTVKQESESFDLNICANNRKVETDYAQGTVKVFFDGGRCKPDDSYSVELRFVCKESEKRLAPSFGNRVSTVSDLLTIKIGGDQNDKKVKRQNNRIKSTKYTLITFLPQNLLEQFRRIANFYFLIMTVIALVIDSPVSPLTSLIPLVFVISVTAAKQGYEDFLRHRADNMVNYSYVTVVRNGVEEDIKCQEIVQGDIVMAVKDCDVPCDLVLIKSSDPNFKCHITTANLDGETNLKTLTVPKGLPSVGIDKLHTLGTIECEQPRTDLYTFNGRIELGPIHRKERDSVLTEFNEGRHTLPLMADNLLLRGSRIKNTEWAVGCAVYIGQNTKLSLNSRLTRNKMSSSEKYVNKFLVFFLLLLIAIVTTSYFLKRYFDMYHSQHKIYLGPIDPDVNPVTQILQDYFSFLILFNYLIPISLYVTIEMHKFVGSFFMEWDVDLYDGDTNQPCIVNTSDLNEELGHINILFSDKTGTLTKNEMIFQECSINGRKYNFLGSGIKEEGRPNIVKIHEFKDDVIDFFQTLSACHTVQVAATTLEPEAPAPVIPNGNGAELRSVNSFTNITEESEANNTQESDFDETDFVKQPPHEIIQNVLYVGHIGDISPLLNERKNHMLNANGNNSVRPQFDGILTKRLDNKVHPRRPVSLFETSSELQNQPPAMTLARPLSIEFTRTISNIELEPTGSLMTHRRTQSYGASTSHNRQQSITIASNLRPQSKTAALLRHSGTITSMREYYAAPSFIGASLIERKESVRRRQEINNAIQELDYQASSPDEKALVEACAKIGFLYTGEVNDVLIVKIKPYQSAYIKKPVTDNELHFERLHTLEFTSDRKRMSTIVKDRKGQIWLLTKGAESHVLPLCQKSSRALVAQTQGHINDFAKVGLRTLAVARKKMSAEEYTNFENEITAAGNSLTDRSIQIAEVQAKLENDLELLGATAVEDALQDNVRDTLESLRHAGIKVWVLTGDKVETALNIALSCGHIPEDANKYFITECTDDSQLLEHFDVLEKEMQQHPQDLFSLLIDGPSLSIALTSYPKRFRDLSIKCRAVLCCRLSPLQKCEVVRLMKTVKEKPITAAIGDG